MKCLGLSIHPADLILISHGLEVSDNQDLLLQEVLRVLKDSGKLVILVPNRTGLGKVWTALPWVWEALFNITTDSIASKKPISNRKYNP